MLLSGRGEGGDSKLRPESEDDAASWLWGPGFHSLWEEQQGAGPEGKDSAWSQGGTEASTAGVGDQAREESRIPQASWAWLPLQERVVGTQGRIETIA